MTCPNGPTAIWVLLLLATLAGFGGAGAAGWGFAAVMLAATVKAHLVVRYYMELRAAPMAWRLLFDGLVGLSGALITALHFLD
ncbi:MULTISPECIES: cytochrome C oxidase subunit IV family protein [Sphingobium]|uniref:Uncharacterized protein n=1 Tax=Sphingobium cupriresistens TaxID=1132417 RepID=A0A8G2DY52_9SPHN|nr:MULTISPECIES: cytochrome C oxidase subunit IV family protein [Sphingobium]MBJ7375652.1 cytochrome C oxidase subunit IV family protein [Sphingobium sp.]RYM07935.1 hypothetical protein EWH12_18000 [Sphingobium cupriresistens]WCP14905.1 hypothetical protein sphantq_03355 [Sphingobium sp. AntQ-1]